MNNVIADITVYNKDNSLLAPCTSKRAFKLVRRKCAVWVANKTIKLLVNQQDRKRRREEIIKESGRICYICGKRIPDNIPITIDHVNPRSNGGTDSALNTKCACKRCNNDKKDRGIGEYVQHIKNNRHLYPYIRNDRLSELDNLVKKFYDTN